MNDSILTLPGDIPGLLRRGSPVWRARAVGGLRCVCLTGAEGTAAVVLAARSDKCTEWYKSTELVLDLSDPTGRAHAAWWLDSQPRQYGTCWSGFIASPRPQVAAQLGSVVGPSELFADLDPDDLRTLPDGSRWVDTEALRRIVLHVAGREGSDV